MEERVMSVFPYEYREIGFGGVRLLNGVTVSEDADWTETEIIGIESLHHEVLLALCTCNVSLTAEMIRAMRVELDLSQPTLAKLLGWKDRQMVSLCERGKTAMPFAEQQLLKLTLASKIRRDSLPLALERVWAAAPQTFDFAYEGKAWRWVNTPHQATAGECCSARILSDNIVAVFRGLNDEIDEGYADLPESQEAWTCQAV
jgi:DNA-binding transcriptional regulator YiaG